MCMEAGRHHLLGVPKPGYGATHEGVGCTASSRLPKHFLALDVLRLLFASHVVFFHTLEPRGAAVWGCTAISFFYALSGFGVAHSRYSASGGVGSASTDTSWYHILVPHPRTLLHRLISVYPTYLVAFGAQLVLVSSTPSVRPAGFKPIQRKLCELELLPERVRVSVAPAVCVQIPHVNRCVITTSRTGRPSWWRA